MKRSFSLLKLVQYDPYFLYMSSPSIKLIEKGKVNLDGKFSGRGLLKINGVKYEYKIDIKNSLYFESESFLTETKEISIEISDLNIKEIISSYESSYPLDCSHNRSPYFLSLKREKIIVNGRNVCNIEEKEILKEKKEKLKSTIYYKVNLFNKKIKKMEKSNLLKKILKVLAIKNFDLLDLNSCRKTKQFLISYYSSDLYNQYEKILNKIFFYVPTDLFNFFEENYKLVKYVSDDFLIVNLISESENREITLIKRRKK